MPGVYKPTVTNFPDGVVSITTDTLGMSYPAIQNSFVSYFFKLLNLYFYTATYSQLQEPLLFIRRDAEGNRKDDVLEILVSTSQFQPAINIDMENSGVVFDGQNYFEMTLLPMQMVMVTFDVRQLSLDQFLPRTRFFAKLKPQI